MIKQTLLTSRPVSQHAQGCHKHAQIQRTSRLGQQMLDLKQQVITTMQHQDLQNPAKSYTSGIVICLVL